MSLAITLLATAAATADDWANWRGPNHNGTSGETNLPTEWSNTDNILWSATLPGPSSSTPIVSGDRVFVSSSGESEKKLHALCFDRRTGERLWGRLIAESKWVPHRSGMSLSSPVTDGTLVYFLYGTSDLFALDFDGNEVWSKNLDREVGPITPLHGYGASPLLHNGKLYIPMIRGQWRAPVYVKQELYTDKDSFIACLDAKTGELHWKVHRPSHAYSESFDSYATPVIYNHGGVEQLILQGGDVLTGHSAETGEELWRLVYNRKKQKYWQLIPTPVIAEDVIVAMLPKSRAAFALRPELDAQYEYEDSLWIYPGRTTTVPSPIYYQGRVYIINGARRTIICLDPKTGEEIWSEYLGTKSRIWATPTAADGKIYCFSETGETIVVAAEDTFKIVAHNPALAGNGEAHSSIAIASGNLFLRTGSALYCVGD
jgi:outer membrane protein assembly factor BamB